MRLIVLKITCKQMLLQTLNFGLFIKREIFCKETKETNDTNSSVTFKFDITVVVNGLKSYEILHWVVF